MLLINLIVDFIPFLQQTWFLPRPPENLLLPMTAHRLDLDCFQLVVQTQVVVWRSLVEACWVEAYPGEPVTKAFLSQQSLNYIKPNALLHDTS